MPDNAALVIAIILAYCIGCISPSTILAKARGIDIKKEGSGNAGTTNALRVMGKKAAVITLIIDILKGVAAVCIGRLAGGDTGGADAKNECSAHADVSFWNRRVYLYSVRLFHDDRPDGTRWTALSAVQHDLLFGFYSVELHSQYAVCL